MSEAAFPAAIDKVLAFEGGYSHDPDDAGGETNFGISKRSYPNVDIAALTQAEAISIYHRDYWLANSYQLLPDVIGAKMLDMAVNMGAGGAGRCLQRACNHAGANLAVDGQVGQATRAAVAAVDPNDLLGKLRVEAANYYRAIVANHPSQGKFLRGWLRRAQS